VKFILVKIFQQGHIDEGILAFLSLTRELEGDLALH
jgi:hypothetical protein